MSQENEKRETTSDAAAPQEGGDAEGSAPKRIKKAKRAVPRGIAHVRSTFNNTIVTVSDQNGDVIVWKSGGTMDFKGSRKSPPFAAQRAAQEAADICKNRFGMREIDVRVQGPGPGRESAIRGLQANLEVKSIEDVTPLPHNGCRPRKKRRV